MTGAQYEQKVARKMRRKGYIFVKVVGRAGDRGADIRARTFPLFRKVVVQCKCYSKPVNAKAVQEVFTAKKYFGASKAIVATNSTFTREAKDIAQKCGVILWERF